MLIRTEPRSLPNTECAECHKIGGLTMIGVDADNNDCPVVHCDSCDEQYSLNAACVDPTDIEDDLRRIQREESASMVMPDVMSKHYPRSTDGGW